MKYLAPERPLYNGDAARPLMIDIATGAVHDMNRAPLPTLYTSPGLKPTGEAEWYIVVNLWVRDSAYRQYALYVDDLGAFAERWLDDPERVLRDEFKYDFNVEKSGKPFGGRQATKSQAQAVGLDQLFGPGLLD